MSRMPSSHRFTVLCRISLFCMVTLLVVVPVYPFDEQPGPDFSGQDLSDSSFDGQDLFGADFRNANLTNVSFTGANLEAASFRFANLTNANFINANLLGADLTGANLAGVSWDNTTCPDNTAAFASPFEPNTPTSCEPPPSVGPTGPYSSVYPPVTGVIGGMEVLGSPVDFFAVWDNCPGMIVPGDAYPFSTACLDTYADAGIVHLSYHPLSWVEVGPTGYAGILDTYPNLPTDGYWMDYDGNINLRGEIDPVPTFSNASDTWLEFMIGAIKTQVDSGATGIGFDEGWGTLGPGQGSDFSPSAMEGFRQYLESRYSTEELSAKGVDDISTFNWREVIETHEVIVRDDFDPGNPLRSDWWETQLGRPLAPGETYTRETFELALPYGASLNPLLGMINPESGDYSYYNRIRLREIYATLQAEIKPYAAAKGQPWYLSANVFNGLDWGNSAVGAAVLDLPMGELSYREGMWPDRNYTSFYKNIAALGKRFNSMFHPGQVLFPSNDDDTEAVLMFIADAHASGGVSQHPGPQYDSLMNPFYELIQAHENFFAETDNRVALYYSLGNHMGDVGRVGEEIWTYYGAARLLEDSHFSYDVLYQGDPDMGPGTVRWVEQTVTLADMQQYEMIVLPQTRYMQASEVQNFLDYIAQGGFLVVLGDAGTNDFGFPEQDEINNPTWRSLVDTDGSHTHGLGQTLVFAADGGNNIAREYDGSLAEDKLSSFQAVQSVVLSDAFTTFTKDVHIHRYQDTANAVKVFHLVNFDYDAGTDIVNETVDNTFLVEFPAEYDNPQIVYFTPESPIGTTLPHSIPETGQIQTTIPSLHVYGIVVLTNDGTVTVDNWPRY